MTRHMLNHNGAGFLPSNSGDLPIICRDCAGDAGYGGVMFREGAMGEVMGLGTRQPDGGLALVKGLSTQSPVNAFTSSQTLPPGCYQPYAVMADGFWSPAQVCTSPTCRMSFAISQSGHEGMGRSRPDAAVPARVAPSEAMAAMWSVGSTARLSHTRQSLVSAAA